MQRIAPTGLIRPSLLSFGAALVAGVGLTQTAAAQDLPRLLVSTTADVPATATLPGITDGSLVAVGGGNAPAPHFIDGHWRGSWGRVPGDVDAFTRMPGMVPGRNETNVFSLLSNEGGFLDGDILVLGATGGAEVLLAEDLLVLGLGLTGVEIDVDAVCFDDLGRLLFSLQSNVAGTAIGDVLDGDVLRYTPANGVELVLSEADVQACFTAATGLSGSIGDVQGLAFVAGEVWVTTQGPTSHDGAVFSCGLAPEVVIEEADVGLGGAELDALSVLEAGMEISTICIDSDQAAPGDVIHGRMRGAPSSIQFVLMAGDTGFVDFTTRPGWGAVMMDIADPWLSTVLAAPGGNLVFLDANGVWEGDYRLPIPDLWGIGLGAEEGWSFQLVDRATLELSAPFRVEKL